MHEDCEITILIPARNEETRLPPFLEQVIAYCQHDFKSAQIIVINDGSTDKTADIVRKFTPRYPGLQLIELPCNKGKGYALKKGMFASRGQIVVFLDADGSTPVSEIGRLMHHIQKGADIVIGSRILSDPEVKTDTRPHRKWIGTLFNAMVHLFLLKEFKDTQCGFKMFRREIVHNLFGRIYLNGFGVDMEILYVAKQLDLRIIEVPVNWHHVGGSKVNLMTDSLRMLNNIFQIRVWHPIKLSYAHPHMSDEEIKAMAHVEASHWWFKAKSLFLENTLANLSSPHRILDVGCGSGANALVLKDKGCYVGTDAVMEALLHGLKRQIPRLSLSNIKELPFKNAAFDLIVCLDVLEHVDDDARALNELKRLLAPNGTLLIGVPSFRSIFSAHDVALSHFRRYNKRDLKDLVNDCGLRAEKIDYWFASNFLPVYFIRRFRNLFQKNKKTASDTSKMPPFFINQSMLLILKYEAWLHKRLPMPFGTTLIAVIKHRPMSAPIKQDELVTLQQTIYNSRNPTRRWLHVSRRDWIIGKIKLYAGGNKIRSLEIGPGSGVYLPALAEVSREITASDIEMKHLKHLSGLQEKLTSLKLVRDDIKNTSLEKSSFDLILCSEVIEHIDGTTEVLKNLYELLKPEGILILSTPQKFSTLELMCQIAFLPGIIDIVRLIYGESVLKTGHINLLTEKQLKQHVERLNFKILESHKTGFYVPLIAEFTGLWGLSLQQSLEKSARKSRFLKGLLWTQYYILSK